MLCSGLSKQQFFDPSSTRLRPFHFDPFLICAILSYDSSSIYYVVVVNTTSSKLPEKCTNLLLSVFIIISIICRFVEILDHKMHFKPAPAIVYWRGNRNCCPSSFPFCRFVFPGIVIFHTKQLNSKILINFTAAFLSCQINVSQF